MDDIDIRQAGVNDCGTILAMLTQLAGELGDGDHFSCRIEDIREHGFGDGVVDVNDLIAVITAWGSNCYNRLHSAPSSSGRHATWT